MWKKACGQDRTWTRRNYGGLSIEEKIKWVTGALGIFFFHFDCFFPFRVGSGSGPQWDGKWFGTLAVRDSSGLEYVQDFLFLFTPVSSPFSSYPFPFYEPK